MSPFVFSSTDDELKPLSAEHLKWMHKRLLLLLNVGSEVHILLLFLGFLFSWRTNDDMYEREYRRHPQWVKYEENLMYLSHNVNLGFVRKLMTSWILLGRVTDRFTAHDWLNPFVLFLGIENGRCKRASLCASPVIVTSHADDPWWTEIKCAVHEHADTQAEED